MTLKACKFSAFGNKDHNPATLRYNCHIPDFGALWNVKTIRHSNLLLFSSRTLQFAELKLEKLSNESCEAEAIYLDYKLAPDS